MVASGGIPSRNRFHLINGYLVEKMTQNPPHAVADELCGGELARVLPPGWHVRPAKPVRLPGRDSEPEPDRCVVRGTIHDYEDHHPGPGDVALIVEVADSSLADDRNYAARGLRARGHPGLLDRRPERPPGRGLHRPGPGGLRIDRGLRGGAVRARRDRRPGSRPDRRRGHPAAASSPGAGGGQRDLTAAVRIVRPDGEPRSRSAATASPCSAPIARRPAAIFRDWVVPEGRDSPIEGGSSAIVRRRPRRIASPQPLTAPGQRSSA